jgi:very-short-patch-repair endonuclease
MVGSCRADARCARIARGQFGVLSRRQAMSAGMTEAMIRRRLASGRWSLVHPSVYRICGAPVSTLQQMMAAQLYGGMGAIVVGRSAAAVWKLEGAQPVPVEIAAQRQLTAFAPNVIARRWGSLEPCDITGLSGLAVTNRVRTLIDMCASVRERTLDIALDQVLRAEPRSLSRLVKRMEDLRSARLRGIRVLRQLVDQRNPDRAMTESALETLVRRWLAEYGFPEPVLQYSIDLPEYGRARLDFAYPDKLIGIEADSYVWHSSREAFERDRARNSELSSLGWIIIQTTAREIEKYPSRPAVRLRRAWDRRA